jgi:hypothetical protein
MDRVPITMLYDNKGMDGCTTLDLRGRVAPL